MSVLKH